MASLYVFALPALAASVQPVPAERIALSLPQGLQADVSTSAGNVAISVDSEKTDWGEALLRGGGFTTVMVHVGVNPPPGAAYYINAIGNADDSYLLSTLDIQETTRHYMRSDGLTSGYNVAEYEPSSGILTPWPNYGEMKMLVRWYDGRYQPIVTEKLTVSIAQTLTRSFYAYLPLVPQTRLQTNAGQVPFVDSQKSHGSVTYTITDIRALENFDSNIQTKVKAPAGAVQCNQVSLRQGDWPLEVVGGYATVDTWYIYGGGDDEDVYLPTGASQADYVLEWLNADGDMVDCSALTIRLHNGMDMQPWPSYVDGWQAVPQDRLHVSQSAAAAGVEASYRDGNLHFQYTGVLPDGNQMDAAIDVSVTPPEAAKAYKMQSYGGNSLGVQPKTKAYCDGLVSRQSAQPFHANLAGPVRTELFRPFQTEDGLTVYFSADIGTLENTRLYLYYWYRDEAATDLLSVEYYGVTSDDFVHVVHTAAVATQAQVPYGITQPVVVGGKPGWKLVIEYYPQAGDNARHYELHLRDENDNIVILQEDIVVYLPYPQGFSYALQNAAYSLKHYDLEFERYGRVQVTPTEKGLRFATSSFSPFVMSWEPLSRPPVSPVPKTGDDFPWAWLSLALAALLASAGVLWKRGLGQKRV